MSEVFIPNPNVTRTQSAMYLCGNKDELLFKPHKGISFILSNIDGRIIKSATISESIEFIKINGSDNDLHFFMNVKQRN